MTVLISNGVSSALGFVFVFIIARALGPAQFGVFSTVVTYATFLAAVLDLGVNQSLVKFASEAKSERERKMWLTTSFLAVSVSSASLGVVFSLIYHYVLKPLWNHTGVYEYAVFGMIFFITLNIFFLGLFQAIKQFINRSITDVSFSIFRLIIIGLVIVWGVITIEWGFYSIIGAYVLSFGLGLFLARQYIDFSTIDVSKVGVIYRFSRWLAGVNFFGNLYGKVDILMLAWLSTAYLTGIYSAAARFIMIFPLVLSSVSSVIAPRFAGFINGTDMNTYFRKSLLLTVGLAFLMALLIPLAYPIILIAYSQVFREAIPIFQLLVAANIPLLLAITPTSAIIYYFKQPQIVTTITFIQLVGLIGLNYLLIPQYGVFGPVYSFLVMNVVGSCAYFSAFFWLKNNERK